MDRKNKRMVIVLVTLVFVVSNLQYSISTQETNHILVQNVHLIHSSSTGRRILFDERNLPYNEDYKEYNFSIENTKEKGYSYLAEKLRKQGHEVYRFDTGKITLKKLRVYDILVLTRAPTYTSEEVNAIVEFVEKGGNLLQLGNHFQFKDLELVSSKFNVHYPQKVLAIVDLKNCEKENKKVPKISQFLDQSFTKGIRHAYFWWSTYLEPHSNGTVLAESSTSSFADETPYNNKKDSGEKRGPFIVLLATLKGKGRAVFTGDEAFMRNDLIDNLDNEKLALNIFEWLSETTPELDIDGDGYSLPEDCNDDDPKIYPGAEETCGKDYNCDGRMTLCTGNLEIITSSKEKEVKVYLDGVYKGKTNSEGVLSIFDLEADKKYTVRVEKEGYHPEEKTVEVEKDTTTRVEIKMEKEFEIGTILLIGLSICGLILVFLIFRLKKSRAEEALEFRPPFEVPSGEVKEKIEKKVEEDNSRNDTARNITLKKTKAPKVQILTDTQLKISKILICPLCKNKIQEDWVLCPYCGVKLKEDTQIY